MSTRWQQNLTHQDEWLKGERPKLWWTGKPPIFGLCPGIDVNNQAYALPILDLRYSNPKHILDYFDNSWMLTELLFSSLQGEEAFFRPPYHGLRHPLIFYYGHPAVFYINKLILARILDKPINREFEHLFAVGVDEMSWDDLSKNEMIWPKVDEVLDYRRKVYETILDLLNSHFLFQNSQNSQDSQNYQNTPITSTDPRYALIMAIEHERIHLETSSVLIRELPVHLLKKPKAWPANFNKFSEKLNSEKSKPKMIPAPGGEIVLGKPEHWPCFGWDNEYGKKRVSVKPFLASQHLITNEDFQQFVMDLGYSQDEYWTGEGTRWRTFRQAQWPTFWVKDSECKFKLRQCFEVIDMPWKAPVIVNYFEAKAYCAWLSKKSGLHCRLLTEAEHHALRPATILNKQSIIDENANLNLRFGSEIPVDTLPPNEKGFYDVFGNVWQWTEDFFEPLPGFKAHNYYLDFSQPYFGNTHRIILGGSFISSGDMAVSFVRNDFRPHFFQHAGFRIVLH